MKILQQSTKIQGTSNLVYLIIHYHVQKKKKKKKRANTMNNIGDLKGYGNGRANTSNH